MSDTKTKILDLAEYLTQQKGFNGFSYLDLAEEIGIKAASIHYHFKSKDDLAVALVERISANHSFAFAEMNATIESPIDRLEALIRVFKGYIKNEQFCLCGMMSAELSSVSQRVRPLLDTYFAAFEKWLSEQFQAMNHKEPEAQALSFLSALEGALLLARLRSDEGVLDRAMTLFLTNK